MTDEQSRLEQMLIDTGDTWDLSPNDKKAIQWALDRIAELEAQPKVKFIGRMKPQPYPLEDDDG